MLQAGPQVVGPVHGFSSVAKGKSGCPFPDSNADERAFTRFVPSSASAAAAGLRRSPRPFLMAPLDTREHSLHPLDTERVGAPRGGGFEVTVGLGSNQRPNPVLSTAEGGKRPEETLAAGPSVTTQKFDEKVRG